MNEHMWTCEFCHEQTDMNPLPESWDLVWQSAVCPSCRDRVKADGGYSVVLTGAYADGRPDPRAVARRAHLKLVMTIPNPSMSVSPEPTKGEALTDEERAARAFVIEKHVGSYSGTLGRFANEQVEWAFMAGAKWRESTYIPLVEAAREVDAMAAGDHAHWGGKAWNCAWCRLRKALVQVPGQQQAERTP